MTLVDSIGARVRRFTQLVKIDSQPVIPLSPRDPDGTPGVGRTMVTRSFDETVPRAEILLNRIPTRFSHGKDASIDMGYDGFANRRFTGFVDSPARALAESTLTCVGQLAKLYQGIDVPEFDASGMTIKQAIENRLTLAGITNYVVHASLDYVLGSVVPAVLSAGPLADQVKQLMDIRDAEIYELSTGQVLVRPTEFQPAPTATGIAYDSTNQALARIIDGSDREDWGYFKDKVSVDGASVPDGDPDDPATTYAPLHEDAEILGSPLSALFPLGDGAHRTAILSQPLIDTEDELVAYASRKLVRFARVPRYVSLDLAGDPTLELAQTRSFNLPGLDMTGRWFVYGLVDSNDPGSSSDGAEVPGYHSLVTLRGGDLAGGTAGIYPIAAFTATVTLQMLGNQVFAIIVLDGSPSDAPDGEIVSWDWVGTAISTSGETVTIALPANTADTIDVTLTVTSSNSLTADRTQEVSLLSTGLNVQQPAVFSAAGIGQMATRDGGLNWFDSSAVAAGDTAVDCGATPGTAVFGAGDGSMNRTTDYNATRTTVLAADAANAGINYIWRDKNIALRWWACTGTGRLLRSDNDGVTWFVYKDFGGTYPLNRIATPQPGGVWVFGGRGDVPSTLIQFDALVTGVWTSVAVGGELDLTGASSALTCWDAYSRAANELGIIFRGALSPVGVNVFWTPNVFDGAAWKAATGLDASLSDGRVIMPDWAPGVAYAMFADRDVWFIDTSSGVPVCTKNPDFLDAGFTPNHGLWEGEFLGGLPGVHLIACEDATGTGRIVKSVNGMQSQSRFRPITGIASTNWPAGYKAKQIAIGLSAPPAIPPARVAIVADFGGPTNWDIAYPNADLTAWTISALPLTVDHQRPRPWCLTADDWFVSDVGGFGNPQSKSSGTQCVTAAARSPDGGATWDLTRIGDENCATPEVGGLARFARDAGGRFWGARQKGDTTGDPIISDIYRSPDGSDLSWVHKAALSATGGARRPYLLITHPTDQDTIALISRREFDSPNDKGIVVRITHDGGGTWTTHAPTVATTGFPLTGAGISFAAMMDPNGRIIVANRKDSSEHVKIWTTDDDGATWQLRYTDAGATIDTMILIGPWSLKADGVTLVGIRVPVESGSSPDFDLVISPDSGDSWAVEGVTTPPLATVGADWDAVYDATDNSVTVQDGNRTGVGRVVKLAPADATGTWQDITGSLPASIDMHWEGISLIPRV